MGLESPSWLLALLALCVLLAGYVAVQFRRHRDVVRFSNLELLASVAPRRPGWRRHLAFALLLIGLVLLTIANASPTSSVRVARDRATVMLAIDVSPSMVATDVAPTRLAASEAGALEFVKLLPPQINLGLVTFGGVASLDVPPTTDRAAVSAAINSIHLVDSTAIGEAVFTCLDAISTFGQTVTAHGDQAPPARIVLMSDGANNMGRSVGDAAAAAVKAGVPVSTIAFGTDTGTVIIQGQVIPVPADKVTLHELASATGGTFHTAASEQELKSVYANLGDEVGYDTTRHSISWRYLAAGLLFLFAAAAWSVVSAERVI